jgi:hypothetical protein
MAAKEEALVLKYLKKNPGSEALDISFGTDVDEAIVKEALQQLLTKQQVAYKMDERGIATWTISEPSKAAPAPKPVKPAASEPVTDRFDAPAPKEESDAPSGGTGKGFVFFLVLLFALISVGASWYLAGLQIQAAKSGFDVQLKTAQEAVGLQLVQMNKDIDSLKVEAKKLQAPAEPAAEEPAPKAKKGKAAVKKAKKKK